MDALGFIKQAKRMCHSYDECENCPAHTGGYEDCHIDTSLDINAEIAVDIVGKWAKEHPEKTRQSVFLEQWPEAEIDKSGCLMLCPLTVSAEHREYRDRHGECTKLVCSGCRRKFWMQEVE